MWPSHSELGLHMSSELTVLSSLQACCTIKQNIQRTFDQHSIKLKHNIYKTEVLFLGTQFTPQHVNDSNKNPSCWNSSTVAIIMWEAWIYNRVKTHNEVSRINTTRNWKQDNPRKSKVHILCFLNNKQLPYYSLFHKLRLSLALSNVEHNIFHPLNQVTISDIVIFVCKYFIGVHW